MYDIILKVLWTFEIVGELTRMSYQPLLLGNRQKKVVILNLFQNLFNNRVSPQKVSDVMPLSAARV